MKLKIYVIKKQKLIWAVVILAVLILCAVLLINSSTKQTMNLLNSKNTYKADINNDGKADTIVVTANSKTGKYGINVVASNGKGYTLEPDTTIKSFGINNKIWPLQVSFKDINDDGKLDIVLQGSDKTGPILHVYEYNSGKIEKMISGRYSVYGTIKNPNGTGTIFVLGSMKKSGLSYTYLSTEDGHFIPFSDKQPLSLGKDTLSSLISFIEKEDVTACNLNQEKKFTSKISKGNFLDAKILSSKYSKLDIPEECIYLIRTNSQQKGGKQVLQYRVKLSLANYENKTPVYEIKDVDKVK